MALKFNQPLSKNSLSTPIPLSPALTSIIHSPFIKPRLNPDVLISGQKFLKGDSYLLFDLDAPIPEFKPKQKIRYFEDEPKEIEKNNEIKSDKMEINNKDLQEIVCINCGKFGHIYCYKNIEEGNNENMNIEWKPAQEFKQMKEKLKIAKEEQQRKMLENPDDDMEMNIAYHIKGIVGNNKIKANSTFAIEQKYKKYKKRLKKSHKLYCAKCGDNHKQTECTYKMPRMKLGKNFKGKHTLFEEKSQNEHKNGWESDESTASNNETKSIEEYLVNALAKGKKIDAKYFKTVNRGLLKRCAKIAKMKQSKFYKSQKFADD